MKLMLISVKFPCGQGEEFLIQEVNEFVRQKHEIIVIPRSPGRDILNNDLRIVDEICVVAMPLFCWAVFMAAIAEICRYPLRTLKALALITRSRSVMVFLKNMMVFPKALWIGRLIPTIGITHIHAHWGTTTSTMAMIASRLAGIPWSFTAHRGDIVENNLLSVKAREASFVRFISKSGLEMARLFGVDGNKSKLHIIHMGVTIPEETAKKPLTRESKLTILCAANLIPVKGHIYLLKAMVILKSRGIKCKLLIVGEGPLREEIERQISYLNLSDTVESLGQLPHDYLLSLYDKGNIDVFVLPSIDMGCHEHEGIPVSLMEAMSYRIPVISTQTGGIPELIKNGAGILISPENPLEMANAIELLATDKTLRAKIGFAGQNLVMNEFSVKTIVKKLAGRIEQYTERYK